MRVDRPLLVLLVALVVGLCVWLTLSSPSDETRGPSSPTGVAVDRHAGSEQATLDRDSTDEREARNPSATATTPVDGSSEDERTVRVLARCLDEVGLPVAGAELVDEALGLVRSRSDGNGRVEAQLSVRGETETGLWVLLRAEFRSPVRAGRRERAGATWDLGDVVLPLGGRVRGRVVDALLKPVQGVQVTNHRATYADWKRSSAPDSIHAMTSTDGAFVLDGVPPGPTRISASGLGYMPVASGEFEVLPRAEHTAIELVLDDRTATEALVLVVHDPDGRPVPGARIAYVSTDGRGHSQGRRTADVEGRARFGSLPGGTFEFRAIDPEERLAPAYAFAVRSDAGLLELRLGLPIAHTLLVVDDEDRPVERFAWRILDENQYRHPVSREIVRDADGLFGDARRDYSTTANFSELRPNDGIHDQGRVQIAAPDLTLVVQVAAEGYALAELGPIARGTPAGVLRVVLERLPGLRGSVVANGEPVSGAWVRALRATGATRRVLVEGFDSRVEPAVLLETRSAKDGTFELPMRDELEVVLQAGVDGESEGEVGPLHYAPQRGVDDLVIELLPLGSIEGRVLVARGDRPSDFVVGASCGDGRPRSIRPHTDGSFRLDALRSGAWTLLHLDDLFIPGLGPSSEIRSKRGREPANPHTCLVRAGETTRVEIDLRTKVELVLRCDAEPWSLARWDVALAPVGATFSRRSNQRDVRSNDVRLRVDAPGEYMLHASAKVANPECVLSWEAHLTLATGENTWSPDTSSSGLVFTNRRDTPIDVRMRAEWEDGRQCTLRFSLPPSSERHVPALALGMWWFLSRVDGEEAPDGGVGTGSDVEPGRMTWNR